MNKIKQIVRIVIALGIIYLAWGLAFGYLEAGSVADVWSVRATRWLLAGVAAVAGGVAGHLVAGVSTRWVVLIAVVLVAADTVNAYLNLSQATSVWLDLSLRGAALVLVIAGVFIWGVISRRARREIGLLS